MITIDLDFMDRPTEIAICQAKSGLPREEAAAIVDIVRGLRDSGEYEFAPTVRGAIMIARSCRTHEGAAVAPDNKVFQRICRDILSSETSRLGTRNNHEKVKALVDDLVAKKCKKAFRLAISEDKSRPFTPPLFEKNGVHRKVYTLRERFNNFCSSLRQERRVFRKERGK
jgi:hypothetical protein